MVHLRLCLLGERDSEMRDSQNNILMRAFVLSLYLQTTRVLLFKSLWTSPTSPRSVMQLELRSHRREIIFMDRFYFKRRRTISVAGQLPWVKLYHDQLRLRACLRNFCQLGPQCPGPRPSMAVGMSTLADMPVSDISH